MIKKEEFDLLYDENITKKQYDEIISKIDRRFADICIKFLIKHDGNNWWYDYGNGHYDSEVSGGYFDPVEYKDEIEIIGEWIDMPPGFYDNIIPTRWLWEDWEEEFEQIKNEFLKKEQELKNKQKENRTKLTEKKQELQKSIKEKLTKEELSAITFK